MYAKNFKNKTNKLLMVAQLVTVQPASLLDTFFS